jgi:hypothetical protein
MKNQPKAQVYAVVEVWRGLAVNAITFQKRADAMRCAGKLRSGRNLEEDDVQVFKMRVRARFRDNVAANS